MQPKDILEERFTCNFCFCRLMLSSMPREREIGHRLKHEIEIHHIMKSETLQILAKYNELTYMN